MTTYTQGSSPTLTAEFFQFGGGPAVDITGLTISIIRISDGVTVLGPTSVGIQHLATGVYAYVWAIAANLAVGDYLVVWSGTFNGQPAQATEVVTVAPLLSSSVAGSGVCQPWTPVFQCSLPTGAGAVSGVALQAATDVLYALSGRQYGTCTVTLRPCRRDCYGEVWPSGWWQYAGQGGGSFPEPALIRGQWLNIGCGGCAGNCSCSLLSEVVIPGPVRQVDQVKVDGQVLVAGVDYRTDDRRLLVRLGGAMWPLCNDLTKSDTQVGTWSVTATIGEDVPAIGQMAVGELALQFTHLLLCNDQCQLPKPVQSVVRQGISVAFLDPSAVLQNGRTGLYLCDLFIQSTNPKSLTQRARAYDIDTFPGNARVIGTG